MTDLAPPIFKPTDKQAFALRAAFSDGIDEILYGGARGGGKTIFDAAFMLEYALRYPGSRGLCVRRDLVDLRPTTLKEFRAYCATYYPQLPIRWNMSSPIMCWININGVESEIQWGDTKDPDSYRSANLNYCVVEEATEVSTEFVLIIKATLGRHILSDGRRPPSKLILTTNPGPGYCKDEFPVGPLIRKRTVPLDNGQKITRLYIPALPKDNPHLPANFEALLRAQYPEVWVKRWVNGDWDAFEGQVFPEFDELHHVLDYPPDRQKMARTGWTHILGADWGFRNPAAGLCCSIDYDGEWWIWDEYYGAERNVADTAPYMLNLAEGVPWRAQVMDYAAQDQSTGTSIMKMFNALGMRFQPCSKRKHGADGSIMFLKRLLAARMLHISPLCQNLIRELKNARWQSLPTTQTNTKSDPEKMVDKDDHAIDALFYAFEYWRHQPTELGMVNADPREQMADFKERIYLADHENERRMKEFLKTPDQRASDNILTPAGSGASYFDSFGEMCI